MSENGTFESIIFSYFIALYTSWGLGVINGILGGRRSTHLASYLFIACPWVILAQNTFILISDLKNDLFNDIGLFMCISFIQKLCSFNYFRARCSYNLGEPFKHTSHQAGIIILIILYFACVFLLLLYNNHVYIVFTAVLMGLSAKFGVRNSFWSCM